MHICTTYLLITLLHHNREERKVVKLQRQYIH